MARPTTRHRSGPPSRRWVARAVGAGTLALVGAGTVALGGGTASAAPLGATSRSWCALHGSSFVGWAGTTPEMAICGPGPDYGGTSDFVELPGPGGRFAGHHNATPGFQCVELAERFLAVSAGLAPVHANGSTVALDYHGAYPFTALVVNGSPGAVGEPPAAGDVVSFSSVPSFEDPSDGHVAVVVGATVDRAGDGTVAIAQENVDPAFYRMVLLLRHWRLEDPNDPQNAEFDYPYAEWLVPHPLRPAPPTTLAALVAAAGPTWPGVLDRPGALLVAALGTGRTAGPARARPMAMAMPARRSGAGMSTLPDRAAPGVSMRPPQRNGTGHRRYALAAVEPSAPAGVVAVVAGLWALLAGVRRRGLRRRRSREMSSGLAR